MNSRTRVIAFGFNVTAVRPETPIRSVRDAWAGLTPRAADAAAGYATARNAESKTVEMRTAVTIAATVHRSLRRQLECFSSPGITPPAWRGAPIPPHVLQPDRDSADAINRFTAHLRTALENLGRSRGKSRIDMERFAGVNRVSDGWNQTYSDWLCSRRNCGRKWCPPAALPEIPDIF